MSVFLGEELQSIFSALACGQAPESKEGGKLNLGATILPELLRDTGDRNRTSPFAFTGNKFEFRSVGSSQSVSFSNVVLNVAVAEALDDMGAMLEARLEAGEDLAGAGVAVVRGVVSEAQTILFEGDNYTEDWHREAEERGLLNLRDTVAALAEMPSDKNVSLFEKYDVLTERELRSRRAVMLEQYETNIAIEAATLESLARTAVLPAAAAYLAQC